MNSAPQPTSGKTPSRHLIWWLIGGLFVLGFGYFIILVVQSFGHVTSKDPLAGINANSSMISQDINASAAAGNSDDVVTEDDPYFGSRSAKVKIVEFGDFECPFCNQALPIVKELQNRFGDRIFFQYRDFPVVNSHPQALSAAEAAGCAFDQGSNFFWAYHDRLFQFQGQLADADYVPLAERIGLDKAKFTSCMQSEKFKDEILDDYTDGLRAGVKGTPTFFINGKPVSGLIPEETFISVVEKLLK